MKYLRIPADAALPATVLDDHDSIEEVGRLFQDAVGGITDQTFGTVVIDSVEENAIVPVGIIVRASLDDLPVNKRATAIHQAAVNARGEILGDAIIVGVPNEGDFPYGPLPDVVFEAYAAVVPS